MAGMAEGLGAGEVAREISEHAQHTAAHGGTSRHDRRISITEAVLLAIVALMAAWSGYASAKWSTESRLSQAHSSSRANAGNAKQIEGLELRIGDALVFNAWLGAHASHDAEAEAVALRRFRPNLRAAFDEWIATDPDTNPDAPPGPQAMDAYREPEVRQAKALKARAARLSREASDQGDDGDAYVRITVYLATVLFLVGISTQFPIRAARYTLIGLGAVIMIFSVAQLAQLPAP
jgi:hypothetical protein